MGDVRLCDDRSPAEIRAALPAARRPEFDVEFLAALAKAGHTFELAELHRVVAEWARAAHPNVKCP